MLVFCVVVVCGLFGGCYGVFRVCCAGVARDAGVARVLRGIGCCAGPERVLRGSRAGCIEVQKAVPEEMLFSIYESPSLYKIKRMGRCIFAIMGQCITV